MRRLALQLQITPGTVAKAYQELERQMAMDMMKSELTKLNVVFEGGAGKAVHEMPQLLKMSNVGSKPKFVEDLEKQAETKTVSHVYLSRIVDDKMPGRLL